MSRCPRVEGAEAVRERFADLLRDESNLSSESPPERVYLPENTAQVASAVEEAALLSSTEGKALAVSGGRTGIVGGAVPIGCDWIVTLSRMKRVLSQGFDEKRGQHFVRVEAGVTLQELDELLTGGEHFYPVDPTEPTAEVGGTVATDAAGARSFHYGGTRKWVRALKVVLPDGRELEVRRGEVRAEGLRLEAPGGVLELPDLPRPGCRSVAGYYIEPDVDLVDLFIGSEGTLAVITEVELALAPRPAGVLALLCFLPEDRDGMELVPALRGHEALSPLSIEYFDKYSLDLLRRARESGKEDLPSPPGGAASAVFFEVPYSSDAELDGHLAAIDGLLSDFGVSLDDTWAGDGPAERERMRALRHGVPEAVNSLIAGRKREVPSLHKVGTDLAVPDEKWPSLLEAYRTLVPDSGIEYVIFGHAGENHLHVNLIPRTEDELAKAKRLHEDLARLAVSLGGTVTAEHGIGRLKRNLLEIQFGAGGVSELRRVKDFFDPSGILNPGVMFAQ